MSNTINENITRRILHEQLMKLVCEDETDKPMDSNVTSSLGQENKKPAQQKHGTWIYAKMHIGDGFSRIYHSVLFHTARDYNDMEYVHKTFPLFSGYKFLEDVDFLFDINTLSDINVDKGRIFLNRLNMWHIVPENIANALVVEMKKWNEDTIKRNKISGMFCTTLESSARKVESMPPRTNK